MTFSTKAIIAKIKRLASIDSIKAVSPNTDHGQHFRIGLHVVLLICLSAVGLPAQRIPGLVEMLAIYPDQEAVYLDLSDSTAVSFDGGGFRYSRHFRSLAMALRRGGGVAASATTPVVSNSDPITATAFTISPEGDTLVIADTEMAIIEIQGNRRRIGVTFPDSRAGAVFVFEWVLESSEPAFSGRRYLGRSYPVLHSRVALSAPVDWVFNHIVNPSCLYRYSRSNEYIKSGELWVNYVWEAGPLPGAVFEPDSPPADEFIPCLLYGFSHDNRWPDPERNKVSWQSLAGAYASRLRELNKDSETLRARAIELLKDVPQKRQRLQRIVSYVTDNFRPLHSMIDVTDTPERLLARGWGSQAEAAFIVGWFLGKADIDYDFVLISTRDNEKIIRDFPAFLFFNRLLLAVRDGRDTIWIDPLYRGAPVGVLPFEDQAVDGLIVGSAGQFVGTPVSDYRENGQAVHLKISFTENGTLLAEGIELFSGSLNIEEKRRLQEESPEMRRERWSKMVLGGIVGSNLTEIEFEDVFSPINPFRVSYRIVAPRYVAESSRRIFLPLDILGRWNKFEFYEETRKLPIELGRPHSQQERITVEIPAGWRVEQLPENFSLTSFLGEIFSVVVVSANTITITRGFSLKPYRLKPEACASLNGFYASAKNQADKYLVLRR